jgi:glycosyltransferase involved in cell wall biosynthesis
MNNSEIFLVDLINDFEGHYFIMEALNKIKNTICIDTQEHKILLKKNPIKGMFERRKMYRHVFSEISQKHNNSRAIVHFLTGDKFYVLPVCRTPETKNLKVIVTIHRFPGNKIQQILLKNFANKISMFVVFSEYIEHQFHSIGIKNVVTIQYPTFYDYSQLTSKENIKIQYGINNKYKIISALGGTRYEKGLDILLDSFKYIQTDLKKKILLNIAGREQDFKKGYIEEKAIQNNINLRLNLKNLTDEEFCENVILSDVIVTPYRRNFSSGASGPMTEAMSQGIPCIFPKSGSLSHYEQYNIGITFDMRNTKSLANAIENILMNTYIVNKSLSEKLTVNSFREMHTNIYTNILTRMSL